ncbi:hypothetical protein R3P38DRAFT_3126196 [Favolaschia claudopus]|uniref:Uncharacterized protein n=1 Tax=Favolaschia claudopus TaxID=2862362 RepID=A0AAV9ZB17_9AGAR
MEDLALTVTFGHAFLLLVPCGLLHVSTGLVDLLRDEMGPRQSSLSGRWRAYILVAALLCMATMLSSEHRFKEPDLSNTSIKSSPSPLQPH